MAIPRAMRFRNSYMFAARVPLEMLAPQPESLTTGIMGRRSLTFLLHNARKPPSLASRQETASAHGKGGTIEGVPADAAGSSAGGVDDSSGGCAKGGCVR